MLKIKDKPFFCELIADAICRAHLTCRSRQTRDRWVKAIAKAAAVLLQDDTTFLHWEPETEILYFWSAESNEIYEVDEGCQCPAFRRRRKLPCYHRAMRQLVKKYFDCLKKPGETYQMDFADAVFFDPELSVPRKIELLNLSIGEGRTELIPRRTALEALAASK